MNKIKELKSTSYVLDGITLILLSFNFALNKNYYTFGLIVVFFFIAVYRHRGFRK